MMLANVSTCIRKTTDIASSLLIKTRIDTQCQGELTGEVLVSWSEVAPSLIALLGIPLAVVFGWVKDKRLRAEQYRREDLLRREQQQWEDDLFARQSQEWRSQQWWHRKADAYSEIIEALWQRLEYANEYMDYWYGIRSNPTELDPEKYRDMDQNRTKLRRAADVGAFVVSNDVAEALGRYFERDRKILVLPDTDIQLDEDIASTQLCLREVREAAMCDLQVTKPNSAQ